MESEILKSLLCKEKLSGLKEIVKDFQIHFTQKQDMIDEYGVLQQGKYTDSDVCAIS